MAIGMLGRLCFAVTLAECAFLSCANALKESPLPPGGVLDLRVPETLKGMGAQEGYFYTPGPVMVAGYDRPSVVTIRNPAAPEPPVATGSLEEFTPVYLTDIPAGFYHISVTGDAGVLVGVSSAFTCNGFYHYRSNGEAYGNSALGSLFYIRGTGGCDNKMLVFSPQGASQGGTCCDTLCIEFCGISFDLGNPDLFYQWSPGDLLGRLGVNSGSPVQVLARDGGGYFVPPYTEDSFTDSFYRTYQEYREHLNVHSFADDVTFEVRSLHSDSPIVLATGTLQSGQTFTYEGGDSGIHRVLKVRAPKGKTSVSVLGGADPAMNSNYMTYVLDQNGNFQGTDFITRSHEGGFLYVTGLQDDTAVEVRGATSETLMSAMSLNQGQLANMNPGAGIWRIRADKDITVAVGEGGGGTFIPLTRNTTGTTPYPPVIVGVRWTPYFPRTSDPSLEVRFLTDEACNAKLHFKIGSGPWQQTPEGPLGTEHYQTISLLGLTEETVVRFRVEARDQSGSVTINDNGGSDFVVVVRKDAPDLEVSIFNVIDRGSSRTIRFLVQNMGAGNANQVELILGLEGFQPFTDGVMATYGGLAANLIGARLPVPKLSPSGSTFVDIDLLPYINHLGSADYRLFSCASSAKDDFGHLYTEDFPMVTHDFDDASIENGLSNTRYVVLANLHQFFAMNSASSPAAQRMPREMALFCAQREATLAYTASGSPNEIRAYIRGRFNGKINSGWRDAG
ncbi:MAG: hypothetical protein HUU16_14895, partial [Candidatus Omnitrophica bacterium]|nr:hypothetical protein [Candidatus Omnitrophota bacterium]